MDKLELRAKLLEADEHGIQYLAVLRDKDGSLIFDNADSDHTKIELLWDIIKAIHLLSNGRASTIIKLDNEEIYNSEKAVNYSSNRDMIIPIPDKPKDYTCAPIEGLLITGNEDGLIESNIKRIQELVRYENPPIRTVKRKSKAKVLNPNNIIGTIKEARIKESD